MLEIIGIICGVLGAIAAIRSLRRPVHRFFTKLIERRRPNRSHPKARVFFNNGWSGFDTQTDDDVLFKLDLDADLGYVRHISINRQYRPEIYVENADYVAPKPDLSLQPYDENAVLEVGFGSIENGEQSSEDYEHFFSCYAPHKIPDTSISKADGGSEALWVWQAELPPSWLQDERPFVREQAISRLCDLVNSWIAEHNKAIERISDSKPKDAMCPN